MSWQSYPETLQQAVLSPVKTVPFVSVVVAFPLYDRLWITATPFFGVRSNGFLGFLQKHFLLALKGPLVAMVKWNIAKSKSCNKSTTTGRSHRQHEHRLIVVLGSRIEVPNTKRHNAQREGSPLAYDHRT